MIEVLLNEKSISHVLNRINTLEAIKLNQTFSFQIEQVFTQCFNLPTALLYLRTLVIRFARLIQPYTSISLTFELLIMLTWSFIDHKSASTCDHAEWYQPIALICFLLSDANVTRSIVK